MSAGAKSRTWLITGCSSGLGRALAEAVLASGGFAIVTARRAENVADLVARYPSHARAVALEIGDTASVRAACRSAIAWRGAVDVLVNNAGFGTVGAVEEVDEEEVRIAFNANVLGIYRMVQAILPHMRARGEGHIVNVSSMMGFVGAPGLSTYCAMKFAVEGLSESLALEIAPFGIGLTIVEPGPFRTDFRARSARLAPVHPAYKETLGGFRQAFRETDGQQPGDPERAAALMLRALEHPEPPRRLALGDICMTNMRRKMQQVSDDLAAWEVPSRATGFDVDAADQAGAGRPPER